MAESDKLILLRISHNDSTVKAESVFGKIATLDDLVEFVKTNLNLDQNQFKLERKSKRHDGYVRLENSKDFKSLKRSLEVKNSLKLKVIDVGHGHAEKKSKKDKKADKKFDEKCLMNTQILANTEDKDVLADELKKLNLKIDDIQKKLNKKKKSPSSKPEKASVTNAGFEVTEDVVIDIPFTTNEFRERIVEVVGKYNTAAKLTELRDNNQHFEKLLGYVNGDIEQLFKIVKESSRHSITKKNKDDYIHVNLANNDSTLQFVLTNKSAFRTPSNLTLVLQILNNDSEVVYTVNLYLRDASILPNYERKLYYNLDAIKKGKLLEEGYVKMFLLKEDSTIYKIGYGDGPGLGDFLLRNPEYTESRDHGLADGEDEIMKDDPTSESKDSTDTESFGGSSFATASNSAILQEQELEQEQEQQQEVEVEVEAENVGNGFENIEDSADQETITSLPSSVLAYEELNSSGVTLTNNNTTIHDDIVTDFSEVSDTESSIGDDYEVLSAEDYATDDHEA